MTEKTIKTTGQASFCKNVLGICLGASTISMAHLKMEDIDSKPLVVNHFLYTHGGNPKKTFMDAVDRIDIESFDSIAVTGRRFHHFVNLPSISEPEAVELAYAFVKPEKTDCPAIVSAGGETFMVYALDKKGKISNVITGNKCASGTGEFFLQQLRRMDISIDDIREWSVNEEPYHVSGRCSVFCKSDCTHATNKGVPKSNVTSGLCVMMANKILELLKKVERKNIMITGGTVRNRMMMENLRKEIKGLVAPEEAPYFEAIGAALWALENKMPPLPAREKLLKEGVKSFQALEPLNKFISMVSFKTMDMGKIEKDDICILGLDVGSTTTKAALIRRSDNAMLASVYLRTNGDPVGASRKCYQSILEQISEIVNPDDILIQGLGICGSGRQIAGLHAMTKGVINEIIAHATAAVHFDPGVDTIFEIGGQDAKYTYITNGVSSDYAMNEACSAGTGSFLEESALESLKVPMEEIADIAVRGMNPPNFNDQCAAFISSDIKNAIHEGIAHEDIVAGLVYSICMNYSNRVKGNRPVGEKVFMQGGVCYNKAVPLAMAALCGKPIIVPPEPGLMGAFGVALAVKNRIDNFLLEPGRFDLKTLALREVQYGKSFICHGGGDKCDRRCEIAMIELEGKKYPFGGACNRYYNMLHNIKYDVAKLDLVSLRQHLVFEKYGPANDKSIMRKRPKIGINRSFLVTTYYPLYSNFFSELGLEPVIPMKASQKGIDAKDAAFCHPGELAHGFFYSLIQDGEDLDYIFLPHFKAVPSQNGISSSQVCPFVQGEPFFLSATFRKEIEKIEKNGTKLISPLIDLSQGISAARAPLVKCAVAMGFSTEEARKAFDKALEKQNQCGQEMKDIGKQVIRELEASPDKIAVVIFSRPYNGMVDEANMGIPHKLASRGIQVIPLDFLTLDKEMSKKHMYWGMGQLILKGARFVEKHPQLFGTYITNFSCGPDSFILGYFRDVMKIKPSLTLELDSHTADAGLETRIEAFLDIVYSYRKLLQKTQKHGNENQFQPAKTIMEKGRPMVVTSSGETISMKDPRVTLLFPSMGRIASEALAAAFKNAGFNTFVHPPSDESVLKLGRANTSCKECLPLILTTGSLLNYIKNEQKNGSIVVYFMPTGSGPCRFGQYYVFMEDLIKRLSIQDVAIFSLTSENGYAGFGTVFQLRAWWAVVISDVMEDMRSMILSNASDPISAMDIFNREWTAIVESIARDDFGKIEKRLETAASILAGISMKRSPEEVPVILLSGEIFVRRDDLSRRYLMETLAEKGFSVVCSPIAEWVRYSDYLVENGLTDENPSTKEKLVLKIKKKMMIHYEKRIKSALAKSRLIRLETIDIESIIKNGSRYITKELAGEAILTIGSSLTEIVTNTCGVIAIGPFGCMPNRLSEAILGDTMNKNCKLSLVNGDQRVRNALKNMEDLPFLAIESDGSPFPQVINAKLETFCLRAERMHKIMQEAANL